MERLIDSRESLIKPATIYPSFPFLSITAVVVFKLAIFCVDWGSDCVFLYERMVYLRDNNYWIIFYIIFK